MLHVNQSHQHEIRGFNFALSSSQSRLPHIQNLQEGDSNDKPYVLLMRYILDPTCYICPVLWCLGILGCCCVCLGSCDAPRGSSPFLLIGWRWGGCILRALAQHHRPVWGAPLRWGAAGASTSGHLGWQMGVSLVLNRQLWPFRRGCSSPSCHASMRLGGARWWGWGL